MALHNPDMDTLRRNIAHLMGRRSISQVGKESGVGQSWLQRFMNPTKADGIATAKSDKVRQLAEYFNVPAADLAHSDIASGRPSQVAGLDQSRLQLSVQFVRRLEDSFQRDFLAESVSLVVAAVYEYLGATEKPDTVSMTVTFGRVLEETDERLRKAAGAS